MTNGEKNQVLRELRKVLFPSVGDGLTDGQLLERYVISRDETAFTTLVRRHGAMVLGVCRRVLRHAQDAEDAYQATFLVLAKKAARGVPRKAVGDWLYGVAYRTALEARSTVIRRGMKEKQVDAFPEPAMESGENWREMIPLLDRELSRLPDKYRTPVILCELEGQTRKEVAKQLGLPEGTLSSRLATARKILARRLAKHGSLLSGAALGCLLTESGATSAMSAPLIKTTVLAAAGKVAVPARVTALAQGALKAMFMVKLKAVMLGFVLIAASAGTAGMKYRMTTAEPQEKSQPSAAGVARDELEALRMEMASLRKELQGMRQRVRSLEDELHTLKTERSTAGEPKIQKETTEQRQKPKELATRNAMQNPVPRQLQTLLDVTKGSVDQKLQQLPITTIWGDVTKESADQKLQHLVQQQQQMEQECAQKLQELKMKRHEIELLKQKMVKELEQQQKEIEQKKRQIEQDLEQKQQQLERDLQQMRDRQIRDHLKPGTIVPGLPEKIEGR